MLVLTRSEWKELLKVANPKYEAPSSKTFTDSLIPAEHAFVKLKQLEHLQMCKNLTISFDGGTTTGLQSIYSVHVITPECRAFLVEGSEASTESHTAQHLFSILDMRFRGITSDNTGNTSAAHRLIQDAYPWIIILPDPCHHLNLLCKDIGNFDAFKDIISQIQRIVQYFHKSTNSTSTLKLKRHELGIAQGIKSVGNTRFALVELFKGAFFFGLQRLVIVLSPMAKAITCLELSHSTVADVYLFWLAVTADVHYMLSQGGLTTSDSEKICHMVNCHFNQMVNEAPSNVYITGFVLDPRFQNVHIMRDLRVRLKKNSSAGDWWARLDKNPDVKPLANKQDALTLVRMATIQEWYRFDPKNHPNLTPPAKSLIILEGQTTPDDPDDIIFDAQGVNFNNFVEGDVSTDNEDANDHISNYSGDRFDLESQINLAAPILHDVLSEDDIDPRILEATTNVNEIDKYCSGEDLDDLKDDDLWKMD
ncbi:hypothetical protein A7U60_g1637 [Sanghuangporus baumii]|uniref:DUF659 domain-containing protein n=1 Tax=Sanghuangporus baumii TaxID=108892 RepID=A0A9Q5I3P4_SANBA|nr:hypothetical protein A7U60_g1637 [Sanghuangporus baumii]